MQQVGSLVEDARSGSRDAFDELVRRHADMAFRYALSVLCDCGLAEDATQEAFVSAHFGLHPLRDDRAFGGWLRGIVRNHALRLLRARRVTVVPLEEKLSYAVMQRLANGTVRCLALQGEGDVHSGMAVTALGRTADRPVSLATLREAVGILLEGGHEPARILETGIKAIDLFCPLPTSVTVGLYGPQGAGKLVVLGELLHRLGSGENRLTLLNFVQADTADTLAADEPLPTGTGPVESFYVPISDASDPASRSVHAVQDTLAAALYCSRAMALEGLYPAVDPTVSWSRMLTPEIAGEEHVRVAAEARSALQQAGPDERGTAAERARKLRHFLTRPFFTTEAFTKLPGEYVSLQQTLEGCAAILSGRCDDVPEEAFRFTGSLQQVKVRATTSG